MVTSANTYEDGLCHNQIKYFMHYDFNILGGSIVNITPVHALGSQRTLFEKEMLKNHQVNILYWLETIHVPVYFNGVDGIMYLFQKPNMIGT